MCEYRFSPSLLDKFQRYLESEQEFESDFNYSEETGYKQSLGDIVAAREQELLDALNNVPQPTSLAASRGTAFNEVVDQLIRVRRDINADLSKSKAHVTDMHDDLIEVDCEGNHFIFDGVLVRDVADLMDEGTMQMHIQAPIHTERGDVLLYGYPDYILPTKVTDLKTTEDYTWGKYEHYWQRYTYPYILLKNEMMERVDEFEFLIVALKTDKKTGVTSGTIYKESYTDVNLAKCTTELQWILNGLIIFVNDHRDQITNPKIFNQC